MGNRGRCAAMTAIAITFAASVILAGCSAGGPNKADSGLAVGAVAGGLLGSAVARGNGRIPAAIVGAFVGGVIGNEIGRSLDKIDRQYAQRAEYNALENGRSGEPVEWRNPDSGRYGAVTPSPPFRRGRTDCREYTHRVYIDGRSQAMRGTACRNPDGTWSSVS